MDIPGKEREKKADSESQTGDEEKDWENPRNPEAPGDQRDVEQLQRQLEEAKRRKENLTEDEN